MEVKVAFEAAEEKRRDPTASAMKCKRKRDSMTEEKKKETRVVDKMRKKVKRDNMSESERAAAKQANTLQTRKMRKKK